MAMSINLIFSVYGFLILIGVPQLELAKFGPWGGDGGEATRHQNGALPLGQHNN